MAKDKPISELPGISPGAVVGLTRDGIVTVADLIAADFDRVAYLVDDYNEATRLVREAAREIPGTVARRQRANGDGPNVSTPVMRSPLRTPSAPPRAAPAPRESAPPPSSLAHAMELAMRGLALSGASGAASRASLRRRLGAACVLLEHGADEHEIAAAMLLEPAEAGAVRGEDLRQFGPGVEKMLDECASLRAVPVLPSGKLPRYYVEMATNASRGARRICAAYLLCTERRGAGAAGARLLADGLAMGEPDELVALAQRHPEKPSRSAAAA